jgi:transcriptional regulator with XRE-family HTH domain
VPAEDQLDRLREDLERAKEADVASDESSDVVANTALNFLRSDDLHPTTTEVFAIAREEIRLTEGHEERARIRVERALSRLRGAPHADPGDVLRKARQDAGVSNEEAARILGINAAAVRRLESGRGTGALLNQPAERVAGYVRRLHIDPRPFLAALFASAQQGAVYGYTPRVADERRGRLLQRAASDSGARDRKWSLAFLMSAEKKE